MALALPVLVERFVAARPGWRWRQAQTSGRTICTLYAPELEGRAVPRHMTAGLTYTGSGISVEEAFQDALEQLLRVKLKH